MKKSKMNTNDADSNFYTYDEFKQFIKYVDDETKPFSVFSISQVAGMVRLLL